MNWCDYFLCYIFPLLPESIETKKAYFKDGDFGDLQRFDIEYKSLLINLDFYSKGVFNVSVIDTELDDECLVLHKLYFPNDNLEEIIETFEKFLNYINGK